MDNYFKEVPYRVTVCDRDGNVIYQNDSSVAADGDVMGGNLKDCHNPHSWQMICDMLESGKSNVYTISKNGVDKLIHQQPWYENGEVAGIIELSIELPAPLADIPHYKR